MKQRRISSASYTDTCFSSVVENEVVQLQTQQLV